MDKARKQAIVEAMDKVRKRKRELSKVLYTNEEPAAQQRLTEAITAVNELMKQ